MPTTGGTYQFELFSGESYDLLATSNEVVDTAMTREKKTGRL